MARMVKVSMTNYYSIQGPDVNGRQLMVLVIKGFLTLEYSHVNHATRSFY